MSLESVYNNLVENSCKAEEGSDMYADDFFTKFNNLYTEEELNNFQM